MAEEKVRQPAGKGASQGGREESWPTDDELDGDVRILDMKRDVVSNVQEIPRSPGICGGFAITGFLDVEKFICVGRHKLFIEKKLPFQIVILTVGGPGGQG